jgi:hypothetical protein
MAKNTYYFPHDYNARNDERIVKLRQDMDWYGVGLFWAIIERLHENGGRLSRDYKLLAFTLHTQAEGLKQIIEDYSLFKLEENTFTSGRVLNNLEIQEAKSKKARESANKRWDDEREMRPHSDGNAKEKRVKESNEKKGEESKGLNSFHIFWGAYPKKVGKPKAEKSWWKINPDQELMVTILEKIEVYKQTSQWKKDNGEFIPHPATWLNQERWNDEIKINTKVGSKYDSIKGEKV